MSMKYIRQKYGVRAKRGGRVRLTYGERREGVIVSARGPYIMVRMDGEKIAKPYHPTWRMEYLGTSDKRQEEK
jgi:hypothetical protein